MANQTAQDILSVLLGAQREANVTAGIPGGGLSQGDLELALQRITGLGEQESERIMRRRAAELKGETEKEVTQIRERGEEERTTIPVKSAAETTKEVALTREKGAEERKTKQTVAAPPAEIADLIEAGDFTGARDFMVRKIKAQALTDPGAMAVAAMLEQDSSPAGLQKALAAAEQLKSGAVRAQIQGLVAIEKAKIDMEGKKAAAEAAGGPAAEAKLLSTAIQADPELMVNPEKQKAFQNMLKMLRRGSGGNRLGLGAPRGQATIAPPQGITDLLRGPQAAPAPAAGLVAPAAGVNLNPEAVRQDILRQLLGQ